MHALTVYTPFFSVVCPSLTLTNGMISYSDPTLENSTVATHTCPTLSDPTNGIVDVASNNLESTATYTCDTGYNLTGGSTTKTCGSDGVWSDSDPTCTHK